MLFLCENNLYAMGTPIEQELARTDIRARAASYGVPAEAVDGMDVLAVEEARDAPRRSRSAAVADRGSLELRTYRFRAHSMADPDLYRTKDEIEHWKERDPIALFEAASAGGRTARGRRPRRARGRGRGRARRGGRVRRGGAVGAGRGPHEGRLHAGRRMSTVKLTYREAVRAALRHALATDERVFLMGEDVGGYGGAFAVSLGLLEEFGPERVRNTPLSESASSARGSARRSAACARSSR